MIGFQEVNHHAPCANLGVQTPHLSTRHVFRLQSSDDLLSHLLQRNWNQASLARRRQQLALVIGTFKLYLVQLGRDTLKPATADLSAAAS